jgi:hypothetical protein
VGRQSESLLSGADSIAVISSDASRGAGRVGGGGGCSEVEDGGAAGEISPVAGWMRMPGGRGGRARVAERARAAARHHGVGEAAVDGLREDRPARVLRERRRHRRREHIHAELRRHGPHLPVTGGHAPPQSKPLAGSARKSTPPCRDGHPPRVPPATSPPSRPVTVQAEGSPNSRAGARQSTARHWTARQSTARQSTRVA